MQDDKCKMFNAEFLILHFSFCIKHFALPFFSVPSVSRWLILSSFVKRQRHDGGRVLSAADIDGHARANRL